MEHKNGKIQIINIRNTYKIDMDILKKAAIILILFLTATQIINAKLSNTQKQYFFQNCEYFNNVKSIEKFNKLKKEIEFEVTDDHYATYCIGYAESNKYSIAYKTAKTDALQRLQSEDQEWMKINDTDYLEIIYIVRTKESGIWKVIIVACPHNSICHWQQNPVYTTPITF